MAAVELIYVWYNDNLFIPDTMYCPFLSNIKFNSIFRKCNVFYYVNKDVSISRIKKANISLYDFSICFPEETLILDSLKNIAQKIDFMKLIALSNGYKVINTNKDLLLIDFDCHVTNISNKIYNLEPFYCKDTQCLKIDLGNETDSYIENYATRIDKIGSQRLTDMLDISNIALDNNSNSYIYMIYVSMIIEYFKKYHNFIFPQLFKDMSLDSSIVLSYHRGGTWKTGVSVKDLSSFWVISYCKPFNEKIKLDVESSVLQKDLCSLQYLLLKELNFPFDMKMFWLNNKQCYGTIKEYILDRIKYPNSNNYISFVDRVIDYQKLYMKHP